MNFFSFFVFFFICFGTFISATSVEVEGSVDENKNDIVFSYNEDLPKQLLELTALEASKGIEQIIMEQMHKDNSEEVNEL
ncbi:unnamed protein product [Caenorhabditis brenneri]